MPRPARSVSRLCLLVAVCAVALAGAVALARVLEDRPDFEGPVPVLPLPTAEERALYEQP